MSQASGNSALASLPSGISTAITASTSPSSGPHKSAAELSIEEQQIIAEIQELQRKLREMKAEQQDTDDVETGEGVRHRRILIVANRLPLRASRDPRTARWLFEDAPGGLATALRGITLEVEFVWVGWVGCDVPASERPRVTERLMREHRCYPVYLDARLMDKYYNGFCNDVLWPLFHYVPLPMYQAGAEKKFDASLWEAYKAANKAFAEAVCEVYDDGSSEASSCDAAQGSAGKATASNSSSSDATSVSGAVKPTTSQSTTTTTASPSKPPAAASVNSVPPSAAPTLVHEAATGEPQTPPAQPASSNSEHKVVAKAADLVWVHDYHLMRLPLELRRREQRMAIAWFLHTPFPSSEVYRILPFRKELLEGLLHADLVGFHTYDYARHFLSACSRVLDLTTTTPKGIEFGGRFCSIGVYPIGIDPNQIASALGSRQVDKRARELGAVFEGRKVLIGVDRLDYIKGMPHKLLAFELFLAKYPEWIGKVTLIQVGVPTRTEVDEYRSLAKHVNELVGRINGVYGSLEYAPIHYINQSIPQEELIAIYHLADACLVTSVRDGMNLVSHEYVAAQADMLRSATRRRNAPKLNTMTSASTAGAAATTVKQRLRHQQRVASAKLDSLEETDEVEEVEYTETDDEEDDDDTVTGAGDAALAAADDRPASTSTARKHARQLSRKPFIKDGPGVLVLSEFAGSAQSLSGAVRVNPWNTEELATAIHDALTMSRVERELRWNKLHRYVANNTASYWARSFVTDFSDVCDHPPLLSNLPRLPTVQVLRAYDNAINRLIVADYDGTLTQIQSLPQLATPAPKVTQLLETLASDPKNTVYVMSGRERKFMDKWLGKLRVGLAAEFGFCHRSPEDPPGEWTCLGRDLDTSWKDVVLPIMQYFYDRTPGTFIESKETSLAWHYRDADPHFGAWQAKDMQIHMEDVLVNLPLEIIQGNRLVEVRHVGVNKSLVLETVLRKGPPHGVTAVRNQRGIEAKAATKSGSGTADTSAATSHVTDFPRSSDHIVRSNSDPVSLAVLPKADAEVNEPPKAVANNSNKEEFDFILCVGDDRSDEDMYQLLKSYRLDYGQHDSTATDAKRRPLALYLVHIGTGATQAEYFLENILELRKIIRGMASISLRDGRHKQFATRYLHGDRFHPTVYRAPS